MQDFSGYEQIRVVSGVYAIHILKTDEVYIGSSKTVHHRMDAHFSAARNEDSTVHIQNKRFYDDLKDAIKDGGYRFYLLKEIDDTRERLEYEKEMIIKFDTLNKYNLQFGSTWKEKNKNANPQRIKKVSAKKTEYYSNPENRKKDAEIQKEVWKNEDLRRKRSEENKEYWATHPEELKRRIAKRMENGYRHSEETIAKLTGKKRTPEQIENMKKAFANRATPEYRKKMSDAKRKHKNEV